jgi:hypothetical protein
MKKLIFIILLITAIASADVFAQTTTTTTTTTTTRRTSSGGSYGNTLNLGLGIGYYAYANRSLPVFHANYEFNVAKNFTLAPFITYYRLTNKYYWGNKNYPYRYYTYRETVIPIGLKGTYYFDDYLKANSDWDFYLAGSLGFAIVNKHWDDGYGGDKDYYRGANPLYLDLHIGTEYHFNNKIGAFLDFSTGVSTIGLAIH